MINFEIFIGFQSGFVHFFLSILLKAWIDVIFSYFFDATSVLYKYVAAIAGTKQVSNNRGALEIHRQQKIHPKSDLH